MREREQPGERDQAHQEHAQKRVGPELRGGHVRDCAAAVRASPRRLRVASRRRVGAGRTRARSTTAKAQTTTGPVGRSARYETTQAGHRRDGARNPRDGQEGARSAGKEKRHHRRDDQEAEHEQHARDIHGEGHHDPEQRVEEKVPAPDRPTLGLGELRLQGDRQKAASQQPVNQPEHGVDDRDARDLGPGDPEQGAGKQLFDVLGSARRLRCQQDRGRRRDDENDPDDRLLRDVAVVHPRHAEQSRREQRREEADEVRSRRPGLETGKGRRRPTECRHLRDREVDEDDAAGDDVDAEVGVQAQEDQGGDQRRKHELQHDYSSSSAAPWNASARLDTHRSTRSK